MAVERDDILAAIRRCAEENGGRAVGLRQFTRLTGISAGSWLGRYWTRWSDAVAEAGYEAGSMTARTPDVDVLNALALLVRDLQRFPTQPDLKLRRREVPTFPDHAVFNRFGRKADIAARLVEHCRDDPDLADVAALAVPVAATATADTSAPDGSDGPAPGEVYLMKSGKHYKIGRSNATGRRAYELAIQLPEAPDVVHVIKTDDAVGIEKYWHKRFADRHLNGEWFALTPADVRDFRRRTFM